MALLIHRIEPTFSDELKKALMASGWHAQRQVPIEGWIDTLNAHGFAVLTEAKAILRNLGGLEVSPVRSPQDAYSPGIILFDPTAAAECDVLEYWQGVLEEQLSPIGEVDKQACLPLAEDGAIYTAWDRFLFRDGKNLEDAMENTLIFGKRRPDEFGQMQSNN